MKQSILIVDDEKDTRELMARALGDRYSVTTAPDAEQAMAALDANPSIALMLSDVRMPGADGLQLLKAAKKKHPGLICILLTAFGTVDQAVAAMREGAEDYIVKPFEILELLVRIEKVLERTGRLQKRLEVGDLTIDLMERTVRRNGREIPLKPMEFDLLATLAKNKNIALSRERLLHGVWGVDYAGETRTVDVHIGQLRKKLGLGDRIRTVSKLGYRLEDPLP